MYYARYQVTNPVEGGTLKFSPDTVTLTEDPSGQYFTGDVYLTKNISNDYSLMDNVPNGQLSVTGYTGTQSESLSLSLPASLAQQSYTLCAYGMDDAPAAKLFFLAPAAYNNQRIMTYVLDSTTSVFVRGFLTINTPALAERNGSIRITKTGENSEPLQGVSFSLYDSNQSLITSGTTDENGQITFVGLALGDYYYQETATLSGYVLDSAMHEVSVTQNNQVVDVSVTNTRAAGSIVVTKTDTESGDALANVHFALYDAPGDLADEGDTGLDGTLTFSALPLGTYFLVETATVNGYVLDSTPREITISTNGQSVSVSVTNTLARASIVVSKTDYETGAPLSGIHFTLSDYNETLVDEGDTGSDGTFTFSGLPLGTYTLLETATLSGYVLDSTPISVTLDTNGQTVTRSIANNLATASIVVVKTDAVTGAPLPGVHFTLADSTGAVVSSGGTDEHGTLSFSNLPLGTYTLTETGTRNGYVLASSPVTITLDTNGQTVTQNITNTPARGSVSILKTDSETGAALAGIHFVLRDEAGAVAAEGDTGADGTLTLPNIPVGWYTLAETATVSGYLLDETRTDVHISENRQIVELQLNNTPIHSTLEILKRDAHEDIVLMGAGFRLFDSTGTQVAEGYTDATGKVSFPNLARGQYVYQEFKAPKGYLLDENWYSVSITENGSIITETRTNERRPGTLIVQKQDADGSPLAGAAFLLEYPTDQGSTWQAAFYRIGDELTRGGCTTLGLDGGQLTTGADGKVTFTGLRADGLILYRLTETKAPPGRTLLADSILVGTLPVESDNVNAEDSEVFDSRAFHYTLEVTATDAWQYRLPETGGNDGLKLLPFAMMFMATPIIYIKTKRRIFA